MSDQVRRPAARVLADLITEAEQRGAGMAILRRLEFPVLVSGKGLSIDRAGTTALYPIRSLVKARQIAERSPQLRIGRGEASEILITADLSVSKRHAMLIQHSYDEWSLASLGRAITRIDGKTLASGEQVPLVSEVVTFEVGDGVEFTFLRERGFKVLFRKLLGGRMGAQLAATVGEAPDESPGSSLSATAQAIVKVSEPARNSRRFLVVLKNALLEEANSWNDYLDLVGELDDQILVVEATVDGEDQVLFKRPG